MQGAGWSSLLAFAFVVALIPIALWLLRRTPLGAAHGGPVRVVAALPLAPNQRLVTVEVGHGDERRWLVLGVTPQGISTLHAMAPQADAPAPHGGDRMPFADALKAVWQRQHGGPDAR